MAISDSKNAIERPQIVYGKSMDEEKWENTVSLPPDPLADMAISDSSNNTIEQPRTVYGKSVDEKKWECFVNLTPDSLTGEVHIDVNLQRVIPVLFIPGIMGSRLKSKGINKMAWDPPNTWDEKIFTLFKYIFTTTKKRMKQLNPKDVEVARKLPTRNLTPEYKQNATALEERGWGSVWPDGYHIMMEDIEKMLNTHAVDETLFHSPKEYGLERGSCALTETEYEEKLRKYRFEVWGGGYNWLQSNGKSADDLLKYIEIIIGAYPERVLNKKKKILVVTHSMGGLVARAMCKKDMSKILGVVHTVMPATGAPATYKRMRAGFEDISRQVLGRNAADCTGIMGAAQGAMELLPFANYNGGKAWLFFPEEIDMHKPKELSLPQKGDPYSEIYKESKWYSLIPHYNEKLVAASGEDETIRRTIEVMVDNVQELHEYIQDFYHPMTYALWGDFTSMDSWGKITWKHREDNRYYPDPENKFPHPSDAHRDNQRGRITQGDYMANIEDADSPGDGTVPTISAEDQKQCGGGMFVHNKTTPRCKGKGYEHSACFKSAVMRWSVKYSMARIVLRTLEG